MYNVDGVKFNVTLVNETVSRVSLPRHYHTKSYVQYAYWLVALLQVCFCLSVCLSVCVGLLSYVQYACLLFALLQVTVRLFVHVCLW